MIIYTCAFHSIMYGPRSFKFTNVMISPDGGYYGLFTIDIIECIFDAPIKLYIETRLTIRYLKRLEPRYDIYIMMFIIVKMHLCMYMVHVLLYIYI